jgi:uncharacterized protein (TIGR03437 family)
MAGRRNSEVLRLTLAKPHWQSNCFYQVNRVDNSIIGVPVCVSPCVIVRHSRVLLLLWFGCCSAASNSSLAVTVSHETAPPGGTFQIKLYTSKPQVVAAGEISLTLDPSLFGSPSGMTALSADGGGSGYASISAGRLDIHFYDVGGVAGMPILAITVPLLPGVKVGTTAAISADPSGSTWTDPSGNAYTVTVAPGAVTAGGSLSVQSITPSGGLMPAGAVLRVSGTGFSDSTIVQIPAVAIASVRAASPQEIDVTLAASADIGGKQIAVQNAAGSQVDFFGSVNAPALGTSLSGAFDGTVPLFPTATYQAGATYFTEDDSGWYVVANPGTEPVTAELYETIGDGEFSGPQQVTIPAGGVYYASQMRDPGSAITVAQIVWAAGPLQMLGLICNYNGQNCSQVAGPMIAMGIPPLQVELYSASVQWEWQIGTTTPQPKQVNVSFSHPAAYTVSASTTGGGNWLSVTPTSGATVSQQDGVTLMLAANSASLSPGYYHGAVTVTPLATAIQPNVVPGIIPVALTVLGSTSTGVTPALLVAPAVLYIGPNSPAGGQITVATGTVAAPVTATATTSDGGAWLSVSAIEGLNMANDTPAYITLQVDQSQLAPGTYHGDVQVSVPGQSADVPVILTVPGSWYDPMQLDSQIFTAGFVPVAGSLLNAASAVEGSIAPGEIVTFHGANFSMNAPPAAFSVNSGGPVPTSLAGAQVLIDGKPIPLLYANFAQINAIVPFEVAGETSATVQLSAEGNTTTWSVPVTGAAPGIFTIDGSGGGQAAVLNADNSVNGPGQAAARGSEIQIFATGIPYSGQATGGVTPSPASGAGPAVTVMIGGSNATVVYAGPAPGAVAGLVQINALVPQSISAGAAVPIVLAVGSAQSPNGVTIAVQ